jgi:hypothetical protein
VRRVIHSLAVIHRCVFGGNTHPVTDVNTLTFGCGPNHAQADHGWTTRKNHHNDTEWIPPPHLDRGQPRINTYHHPEKLLRAEDNEEEAP